MSPKNACGWLLAASLPVILSACGSDDPPPRAGISFEKAEMEVTESDGTPASFHPDASAILELPAGQGRNIAVKLKFDNPLAEETVIAFTLDGTTYAYNPPNRQVNDFSIAETGDALTVQDDKITIAKGATEAAINITVYEDLDFEYDNTALNSNQVSYETLILTLTSVVSGPADLGDQKSFTLKIVEDDAVFILTWGIDGGDTQGDVDMDLLFLNGDNAIVWGSAQANSPYEIINFPAGFPSGTYGGAYTYYSGSSADVAFAVGIQSTSGTVGGKNYPYPEATPLIFDGHLGLGNINVWDDDGHVNHKGDPVVVQTFIKDGLNYTGITSITTLAADASSRQAQKLDFKHLTPGKIENRFKFSKDQ